MTTGLKVAWAFTALTVIVGFFDLALYLRTGNVVLLAAAAAAWGMALLCVAVNWHTTKLQRKRLRWERR